MRPGAGRREAVSPSTKSRAPGPSTFSRVKPEMAITPQVSRTASHSSRIRASQGPARFQVCVAVSPVSSPGWANQLARSQPL